MKTIVGLFESPEKAQIVLDDLVQAGCNRSDIELSAADMGSLPGEGVKREEKPEKQGGFLSWLFGEDEDRYAYQEGIRRGRTAVAVKAPDENEDTIAAIMDRHDPIDLNIEAERWRQEGWAGAPPNRSAEASIPVMKEEVEIGKRAVERGGLRIYSRVVERPVAKDVTLSEEKVNVERRPADRPLKAGEAAFQERTIELHETDEEPVISKTARVVEEVNVSKERRERKQRVEDTERHTEVEVEHLQSQQRPTENPRRH